MPRDSRRTDLGFVGGLPGGALGIELKRRTGAEAAEAVEELTGLYVAVYAEPPYGGGSIYARDAFITRTIRQASRDGFTLITAHDGGQLAGFSFGLPFEAGSWWAGIVEPGPPAELVEAEKFAVIELVVAPSHRGRGLSTRLLGELLAGRTEPYAMLLAHPQAPARAMYERWGWRQVGTNRPRHDAPAADVLVLGLGGHSWPPATRRC